MTKRILQRYNLSVANTICYILPIPVILISLFVGSSNQMNFGEYIQTAISHFKGVELSAEQASKFEIFSNILLNVRLPRVILTFMVGSALSVSGAVLQGIFRNPLVDSYILGISSGAAFGASLAILYGLGFVNFYAFVLGGIAVGLTYLITGAKHHNSTIAVVLSGMIISGIFLALLTLVQYIANPYKLQSIVQWAMGNLHSASWIEVKQGIIPIIVMSIICYAYRWRLNILALGDDSARAVGVNPTPDKIILIIAATLLTATTVAVAGIISFYGLFLPHIVRMLLGADNKKVIPGSIFLGGTFLLVIDDLSRSLFLFEIPIGVFTTLFGGAFFIFLLKKKKLNWN